VILGRTGLQASRAGLGCGGHSRLGQAYGASESESIALVERALDIGVTFIDTAFAYGTEEIVGRATAGRRGGVILSSKAHPRRADGRPVSAADLARFLEGTLRRLRTDCIDVYHLHGVSLAEYDHCVRELVPAMLRLREQGKLRALGITERFAADPAHRMLERAVADGHFDVIMVGYNMLNPSARDRVLAPARAAGIGTLIMFAVRRALSRADELARVVAGLREQGHVDACVLPEHDPLGFLVSEHGAASVVDAAYRYCRHTDGADVVLTGTGSAAHLLENVRSIAAPPLPPAALERVERAFGKLDFLSGN
jgi:aryl-alcohol dehydrogenase-like predicted oxidoreductase